MGPYPNTGAVVGQVRDLQRLLGKKTMEAEILKEALELSAGSKKNLFVVAVVSEGRFVMKKSAGRRALQHHRQGQVARRQAFSRAAAAGRRSEVDKIKAVIREMPTYGYRWVWAVLWRATKAQGLQPPNHKTHLSGHKNSRSSAAMLCCGAEERRHDGRIAVDHSNLRWCSDTTIAGAVRALQHGSPASSSQLSFTVRVHRHALKPGERVRSLRDNDS